MCPLVCLSSCLVLAYPTMFIGCVDGGPSRTLSPTAGRIRVHATSAEPVQPEPPDWGDAGGEGGGGTGGDTGEEADGASGGGGSSSSSGGGGRSSSVSGFSSSSRGSSDALSSGLFRPRHAPVRVPFGALHTVSVLYMYVRLFVHTYARMHVCFNVSVFLCVCMFL